MDKIVSLVSRVPKTKPRRDDDAADRLNHKYTTLILVTFAVVVSMYQYVGRPMACWAPKHFTRSHTKYTNSYCWVRNTYYLPFADYIPKEHEEDKRHTIIYYQWMPFVFLLQAFFFYLPRAIWTAFNSKSGVDADNILLAANSLQNIKTAAVREKTLNLMTKQIDRFVCNKPGSVGGFSINRFFFCCGKGLGNYLVILYILCKSFYIANILGQLFLLNSVFKTSYNIFAAEFFKNLYENGALNSRTFPRVTMCDLKIRVLGNVQRYTVQCVLPINFFTEKMYLFLWFWMVIVASITALSLLVWCVRALLPRDRHMFITNHLQISKRISDPKDEQYTGEFVLSYLRQDGVFVLRMIAHNTNHTTVTDIVSSLWDNWSRKHKSLDSVSTDT